MVEIRSEYIKVELKKCYLDQNEVSENDIAQYEKLHNNTIKKLHAFRDYIIPKQTTPGFYYFSTALYEAIEVEIFLLETIHFLVNEFMTNENNDSFKTLKKVNHTKRFHLYWKVLYLDLQYNIQGKSRSSHRLQFYTDNETLDGLQVSFDILKIFKEFIGAHIDLFQELFDNYKKTFPDGTVDEMERLLKTLDKLSIFINNKNVEIKKRIDELKKGEPIMINLETQAVNFRELLILYRNNILQKDDFQEMYGNIYGNLYDKNKALIIDIEVILEEFRHCKKELRRDNLNPLVKTNFNNANKNLIDQIMDVEEFWIKVIIPSTEKILTELPAKVEQKDIELPPTEKNNILEKANDTLNTLQEIARTGKKVWETVKEYKSIILAIGSIFV